MRGCISGVCATIVSLVVLVSLNMGGCVTVHGNEDSVLLGTWRFQTDDGAIKDIYLTFDAAGKLTSVRYAVGGYASITDSAPHGTTSVAGNIVTVTTKFGLGNLTFSGTLDSSNALITGNTSFHFQLFVFSLQVDSGGATLTKQ